MPTVTAKSWRQFNNINTSQMCENIAFGSNEFSFFSAPIKNTIPKETLTFGDVYNLIVSDVYNERTNTHRRLDLKTRKENKGKSFDYICPNGVFSKRGDDHLIRSSGAFVVDID